MITKLADKLFGKVESHPALYRSFVIVLSLVIIALASSRMIRRPFMHGDFGVYLHAARLLLGGRNIYTTPVAPVEQGGLFYIYPPLLAFLFIPLTYLPENISIVLWTALNVALVAWMVPAVCELCCGSRFSELPAKTRWSIGAFSVLLTGRFILQHLDRGQTNLLVLALVVLGIGLIQRQDSRPMLGGALVGLTIALKVLPGPFLIWFLFRRQFKALAGAAAGLVSGLSLPALLVGWKANWALLSFWISDYVLNTTKRESKLELEFNYSLRGVLYRFFTPAIAFEHGGRAYSFMIFPAPASWIIAADWLLRFAVLGVVILYWVRFRRSSDLVLTGGGTAVLLAAIPLLYPTTQQNYFVFLLPAAIYAMYVLFARKLEDRSFQGWLLAFFVLGTMTVSGICGKFLSDVGVATGCTLWGTLCLIAAIFRAARVGETKAETEVAEPELVSQAF